MFTYKDKHEKVIIVKHFYNLINFLGDYTLEETLINFLLEYASILKKTYVLNEVTDAILKKTAELFDSEGSSLLLYDKKKNHLYFENSYNIYNGISRDMSDVKISLGESIAGKVALTKKPIIINDTSNDSRFISLTDNNTNFKTKMLLAHPITAGEELVGVIEIQNRKNRPYNNMDLKYLNIIGSIIGFFIEKAKFVTSKMEFIKMEKELEIARELQTGMMPSLPLKINGHHFLYGEVLQNSGVGGDFWDIIEFKNGETLFILGDVSGHGLRAGFVMSAVRLVLKTLALPCGDYKGIINILNQVLYNEFGIKGIYTTFLFCWFKGTTLHMMRAGHVNPILKRDNKYTLLTLPSGHPIGLLANRKKDHWITCDLKPGDVIYFYTDGIQDGFPDKEIKIESLFKKIKNLDKLVLNNDFFSYIKEKHDWKNNDDATLLMLSLGSVV